MSGWPIHWATLEEVKAMYEKFEVKDSGERKQFDGGMVRDTNAGKTRYDLALDGPMFKRWAEHMTKGAEKYAARNWMLGRGEEVRQRYRESALRHFMAWWNGQRDEDHAAGVFFNVNGAEFVEQAEECRALPAALGDTSPAAFEAVLQPAPLGYLSGPMTGLPDWNAPAFARYAALWRDKGWRIISPPELDGGDHSGEYAGYLRRDIKLLVEAGIDAMIMLPGWEQSRGARVERHIAEAIGIPVVAAETGAALAPNFFGPSTFKFRD